LVLGKKFLKNPEQLRNSLLALVVHTCNPSYSGGKDQDSGSKPTLANSSVRPFI
jgi:hypothetical protein